MDGTNINSTKAENFLFLHDRTFVWQSDKNTEHFCQGQDCRIICGHWLKY